MNAPSLKLVLLLLFSIVTICAASYGDQQYVYRHCVADCASRTDISELPFYLRLLRWNVQQNCGYHCMHQITQRAIQENTNIYQYHGKWPFYRLYGIQEPASVLFSILNGLMHLRYFQIIRRQVNELYQPLKTYYLITSIIGMNAWLWSTVFHTRDTPFTEKMDYFSAGLYIFYGLCVAVIRIFGLQRRKRATMLISGWTAVCAVLYIAHVTYLSSRSRFDYGYNMKACIAVGSLQTTLWLNWSILQYTRWGKKEQRPFAWMAGLSVVLVSCAMCLEVFDFPPYKGVLDAHSLWHASTIPLAPLFYKFLLKDAELDSLSKVDISKKRRLS
ncbi:Per1-like protein [Mycotypha africana]|uniref:Per1-like protein n=1 Tax=Mycotypha africana TaxID=64632 RepID=UPI002301A489|nr:Per1-like protein [Mycotypha africana]KAI8987980.1 Per1-like protein [Mycotypha africana]